MRVRIDKSTPNEFGTYMKVQLIAIVFSGCFFLESFNPAALNEVACCIVKKKGDAKHKGQYYRRSAVN